MNCGRKLSPELKFLQEDLKLSSRLKRYGHPLAQIFCLHVQPNDTNLLRI